MNGESLYCIKMRASKGGEHISGAERIVKADDVPGTADALASRALHHSKGVPDFINIKLEDNATLFSVNLFLHFLHRFGV